MRWILLATFAWAVAACGVGDSGPPAATCGTGNPAACNTITLVGATITTTCSAGTAPGGTGGTIADGTYVLTSETVFSIGACDPTTFSATLVITGSCWQETATSPNGSFTEAFVVAVGGSEISESPTCVQAGVTGNNATATFTATASTLTVFASDGAVLVYTKQ